jgi:hypothetical protein
MRIAAEFFQVPSLYTPAVGDVVTQIMRARAGVNCRSRGPMPIAMLLLASARGAAPVALEKESTGGRHE